jgi:hypothetical protein
MRRGVRGCCADDSVFTGEEDEETVFQTRVKLFSMEEQGAWRERGLGALCSTSGGLTVAEPVLVRDECVAFWLTISDARGRCAACHSQRFALRRHDLPGRRQACQDHRV